MILLSLNSAVVDIVNMKRNNTGVKYESYIVNM